MAGENNETEGTEPKTFKENFTDFAKNLGSSLNVFKQNVQNAIDGVNESIRSDVSNALSKYWAKEYDPFGKGEILGSDLTKTNSTIFLVANDGSILYNSNFDIGDYSATTTMRDWAFTNYLSQGKYLVLMQILTGYERQSSRSQISIRARMYNSDEELIVSAGSISYGGDTQRTTGTIDGSGLISITEEGDNDFTVSIDRWNGTYTRNYYGVLLTFIRLF